MLTLTKEFIREIKKVTQNEKKILVVYWFSQSK